MFSIKKSTLIIFLFISILHLNSKAQSDSTKSKFINREGFFYSINTGVYFANDNDADFYNGAPNKANSIYNALGYAQYNSLSGSYWSQLEDILGEIDTIIAPTSMSYNPSVLLGVCVGYNLTNDFGIYIDAHYTQLKTEGAAAIVLTAPKTGTQIGNDINQEFASIYAQESRFKIDLGIHKAISLTNVILPYFDIAGTLTSSKTETHKLTYNTLNINLIDYTYNNTNYQTKTEQTGVGYGLTASVGIQMPLGNKFYIMLGYDFIYSDNGLAANGKDIDHAIKLRFFF